MRPIAVVVAATLLASASVWSQEVTVASGDTLQSVLGARKGKRVTVRLRSGQELTGIVRDANGALVVLGAVTGREFFDAVVPLATVEAILVRTRDN